MATVTETGLGSQLQDLLMRSDIEPGTEASYQLAKTIYLYHPLGGKMVDGPVKLAMSQPRDISIPKGPEERVREAFEREWQAIGADKHIAQVMTHARIYGVGAVAFGAPDVPTDQEIDPWDLPRLPIYINVYDPLNTAGSLVLNQQPNSPDFQKVSGIRVAGQAYHRSRATVVFNEQPIYISYTSSAFGYVGRSVYQRALYPLKSYIRTMIADDMVATKAGVIVAKVKMPGSVADRLMQRAVSLKRSILKEAQTDNVINIDPSEEIETLNLQNVNDALATSRKNILENIAAAADMPAVLLNNETYAEGFGEGSEDAKAVGRYIDNLRTQMQPLYDFFDRLVQYRAWNPEFYASIQADFPEYQGVDYQAAFYEWANSFDTKWPNYLTEPDSEKAKVDDIKYKAIIGVLGALLAECDPENKAKLVQWAADNLNENKTIFSSPLVIDAEAMAAYEPPQPLMQQGNVFADASVSEAQHRAMEAAAHGKSTLGIPKSVGQEFVSKD